MNNINQLVKQYVLWPELKNDFQKNIDFSQTIGKDFIKEVSPLLRERSILETQIASFYLTNERLSQIRSHTHDVLGTKELEDYSFYQKNLNQLSKKLFSYILTCSIVEARHCQVFSYLPHRWEHYLREKSSYSYDNDNLYHKTFQDQLEFLKTHKYGTEFFDTTFSRYTSYLHNGDSMHDFIDLTLNIRMHSKSLLNQYNRDTAYPFIGEELFNNSLAEHTLEKTLSYIIALFTENDFNSGYGGLPWAKIAQHGMNFLKGKINAEVFIDQAFSLEHNNGNMFNKEFLFDTLPNTKLNYLYTSHPNGGILNGRKTFTTSKLLLDSQHLGNLSGLFSLDSTSKKLQASDPAILFTECKKIPEFSHLDQDTFNKYLAKIITCYKKLSSPIVKIKKDLLKNYSTIYSEMPHQSFNITNLLYEYTKNANNTDSNIKLSHILQPQSHKQDFFNMLNYFHNQYYNPNMSMTVTKEFNYAMHDINSMPETAFNKNVIGGKAWSLTNMSNLGFPVPKAKVFTTDCCAAYYQHKNQFISHLNESLSHFPHYLTNHKNKPVLCSVRSGSAISMPGMMDTVLNVGIDDSNYNHFCKTMGKKVTDKCAIKFMELFCSSRIGQKIHFQGKLPQVLEKFTSIIIEYNLHHPNNSIDFDIQQKFPLNQETQIRESLYAVFESWNSPRAIAYRNEKGISHDLGTAAIVQQMVFGNLNEKSCTGVVFSRDCLTGEDKLVGEFLPKAQGEDVVSGSVTPFPIEQFKKFNPQAYDELLTFTKQLEKQTGHIQDIEFTVEDGQLYILQHREAICSPIANIKLLEDKSLDHTTLLKQINPKLLQPSFTVITKEEPAAMGLSANSGILSGIIIKSEADMSIYQDDLLKQKNNNPDFGWIFYAELTSPEHMPLMNKTQAFITEQGGFTSHAAIIARSLNKPCIVGLGGDKAERFKSGDIITIDATQGKIWKGIQTCVDNFSLANAASKILIDVSNVNISDINEQEFEERLSIINNQNNAWALNLPNSNYVHEQPIKISKFLDIGQKIALILAASHSNPQINENIAAPVKKTKKKLKN